MSKRKSNKWMRIWFIYLMVFQLALGGIGTLRGSVFADPVVATTALYVSPEGNDLTGDGSSLHPFATLVKAKETVRTLNGNMDSDITVYLRGGTYYQDTKISFNESDSGTNGYHVVYTSYPDETVEIIGGQPLTGWTLDEGSSTIYKTSVAEGWKFYSLFENGVRSKMARTPNAGYLTAQSTANKSTEIGYKEGDLPEGDADYSHAQVYDWPGDEPWWNWSSETRAVTGVDADSNKITLEPGGVGSNWQVQPESRYFIQGAKALLDQPGEFYLNEDTNTLYYWPMNADINNQSIVAPTTQRILELKGSTEAMPVHDITFKGLTFRISDFGKDSQPTQGEPKDGMIYLESAKNITISQNHILGTGHAGIMLYHYAQNNTISENWMEDLGTFGVGLFGWPIGEGGYANAAESYVNKHNIISSNYIQDFGKLLGHGSAVQVYMSGDNEITHNEISKGPRYGISMKGANGAWFYGTTKYGTLITGDNFEAFNHTRNNNIAFNDISDVMKDTTDGGALESWCPGQGNIVNNNRIHDIYNLLGDKIMGIYLDDNSSHFTVTNNIIYGIHSVEVWPMTIKGTDNEVSNNIIADSDGVVDIYVGDLSKNLNFKRNIIYRTKPKDYNTYFTYAWDSEKLAMSDNNLIYHGGDTHFKTDRFLPIEGWKALYGNKYDQHSLFGADPLFVDAPNHNYMLQASSPALGLGFNQIDQASIGLKATFPWAVPDPIYPVMPEFPQQPGTLTLQAENYDSGSNVYVADIRDDYNGNGVVGNFEGGDYLLFRNVNLQPEYNLFTARYAVASPYHNQLLQIRLDSLNGPVVSEILTEDSGSWEHRIETSAFLQSISGLHDIYIVGVGGDGIGNLDSFKFSSGSLPDNQIMNPGFESGLSGWQEILAGIETKSLIQDKRHGAKGYQATLKANGSFSIRNSSASHLLQGKYEAGLWAKSSGAWESLKLKIMKNNTLWKEIELQPAQGSPNIRSQWNYYRVKDLNVAANEGLTVIVVGRSGASVSTVALDDFSVVRVGDSSGDIATTLDDEQASERHNVTQDQGIWKDIDNGDWIKFAGINLGQGYSRLTARYAAADSSASNQMELHLGSPSGALLGRLSLEGTGGFDQYVDKSIALNLATGIQDVYIVFTGGNNIGHFDWFKLSNDLTLPVNLLANPGLEGEGNGNWSPWIIEDSSPYNAGWADGADGKHSGSFGHTHWSSGAFKVKYSQTLASVPAGRYKASVWARTGDASWSDPSLKLSVYEAGNLVGQSLPFTGGSFVKYEIPTINLTGTGEVRVIVEGNSTTGGWLSIDDFELIRSGNSEPIIPVPQNLLQNSGFESGIAGWTEENSSQVYASNATGAGEFLGGTTARSYWLNGAPAVEGNLPDIRVSLSQTVSAVPAGSYRVEVNTRRESFGQPFTKARLIVFYGNTELGSANLPNGGTFAKTMIEHLTVANSSDLKVQVEIVVPGGNAYLTVDDAVLISEDGVPTPSIMNLLAKDYTLSNHVEIAENSVVSLEDGDYFGFANLYLYSGFSALTFRYSNPTEGASLVEVRADSPNGTYLGGFTAKKTGGSAVYMQTTIPLVPLSGQHDLYVVIRKGDGQLRMNDLAFTTNLVDKNVLVNPGFESNAASGWSYDGSVVGWNDNTADSVHLGDTARNHWMSEAGTVKMQQTVEHLPAGYYKASAWSRRGGHWSKTSLKVYEGDRLLGSAAGAATETYGKSEVQSILVPEGASLTVVFEGAASAGNTFLTVDDIELIRQSTNTGLLGLGIGDLSFESFPSSGVLDLNVSDEWDTLAIVPALADKRASVFVNGAAVSDGDAYSLSLSPGSNTVAIQVAAEEASFSKSYAVHVNRHSMEEIGSTPDVTYSPAIVIGSPSEQAANENEKLHPEQQLVNEQMLRTVAGGKVEIELASGKNQLILPAHAGSLLANNLLTVKSKGAALSFPASVLTALEEQLDESMRKDAQIVISITESPDRDSGVFTLAGSIYSFQLSIVAQDGTTKKLAVFPAKVKLSLPYSAKNVDRELLGIYRFDELSSSWLYLGGKGDQQLPLIEAETEHFSQYAVMEFRKSFDDVPLDHYAHRELEVLAARHIVTGVTNKLYLPNSPTTRAEFSTMLARALGLKASLKTKSTFGDVQAGSWYSDGVLALYEAGIVKGKQENSFAPQAIITRQEMAVMMSRVYFYLKGTIPETSSRIEYTDQEALASWATEAVDTVSRLGIMKGTGVGIFSPTLPADRAQTAKALYQLLRVSEQI